MMNDLIYLSLNSCGVSYVSTISPSGQELQEGVDKKGARRTS